MLCSVTQCHTVLLQDASFLHDVGILLHGESPADGVKQRVNAVVLIPRQQLVHASECLLHPVHEVTLRVPIDGQLEVARDRVRAAFQERENVAVVTAAESGQVGIRCCLLQSLDGVLSAQGAVVTVIVLHELSLWYGDSQWRFL